MLLILDNKKWTGRSLFLEAATCPSVGDAGDLEESTDIVRDSAVIFRPVSDHVDFVAGFEGLGNLGMVTKGHQRGSGGVFDSVNGTLFRENDPDVLGTVFVDLGDGGIDGNAFQFEVSSVSHANAQYQSEHCCEKGQFE